MAGGKRKKIPSVVVTANVNGVDTISLQSKGDGPLAARLEKLVLMLDRWMGTLHEEGSTARRAGVGQPFNLASLRAIPKAASPPLPSGTQDVTQPDGVVVRFRRGCTREENEYLNNIGEESRRALDEAYVAVKSVTSAVPLKFRVLLSSLPADVKVKIFAKLEKQQEGLGAADAAKFNTWAEGCLSIPLGRYVVSKESQGIAALVNQAREHMDESIYGHPDAKQALLEMYVQWLLKPMAPTRAIGLVGEPGTGKTSLIKEGFARICGRPFYMIALGGSSDASTLLGHGYTYEGSCVGRLAEALASCAAMNPVIYFDELDKCSGTTKGEEIQNVLIHITDSTQSHAIRDRYLHGIDLDFSRATFVFAFNDETAVNKILLDRIKIIRMDTFDCEDRANVILNHLLPQCLRERDMNEASCKVSAEAARKIALWFPTIRGAQKIVEDIVSKAMLWRTVGQEVAAATLPLRPEHFVSDRDGSVSLSDDGADVLLRYYVDKSSDVLHSSARMMYG